MRLQNGAHFVQRGGVKLKFDNKTLPLLLLVFCGEGDLVGQKARQIRDWAPEQLQPSWCHWRFIVIISGSGELMTIFHTADVIGNATIFLDVKLTIHL